MKGCLVLLALPQHAQAQAALSVVVRNATAQALECQALAAHWYSWPALTAPPGGSVTFRLMVGADGAVADIASGLPVERLFCGPAGRAWQGRAEIDLRGLGTPTVVCRGTDADLVCDDRERAGEGGGTRP